MNIRQSSLLIRHKGELPPTPALPGSIQTLACRWMPLAFFEWCRRKYGNRFTLYPIDMQPVVFLSHPSDIRAVLNAPASVLHPGAGGAAIRPIVGRGSFMLKDAEEHMHGRRAILPEFTMSALEEHTQMIHEVVTDEVESWPYDTPFAVHPRLRSMSLRIILRTVFDEDPAKLQALHDHMLKMLDVTRSFALVEPRLRHLPIWRGIWRRFTQEREHVDREIHALIAQRRTAVAGNDLLARLLATFNPDGTLLTPYQVRDSLVSVILAGHETTASEIAWALQLLAHNPSVQHRLACELDVDREDSYLLATVDEVLRHRPVFLFAIPRVVVEPIEIRGWTYRPPAQLLACIYLLHHDPQVHGDPHVFRPERFIVDAPPGEWLPWGGGRKRCPGHRLATLEMQTVARATLATRVIEPVASAMERARWRSVIVTPAQGGRVLLRKRGSTSSFLSTRIPG